MKKLISVLLCICMMLSVFVFPASAEDTNVLSCIVKEIIAPQYDDVKGFSDGYAAVKVGDLWGYVDTTGKMVIEPQYLSASEMENGYAVVSKMGKTIEVDIDDDWNPVKTEVEAEVLYIIDTKGNETPLIGIDYTSRYMFEEIIETHTKGNTENVKFYEGVAVYNGLAYGLDGKVIVPKFETSTDELLQIYNWYDVYSACYNGLIPVVGTFVPTDDPYIAFLMDKNGNIVRTYPHSESMMDSGIIEVVAYNEGVSAAWYMDVIKSEEGLSTDTNIGLLGKNNNWVLEPKSIASYRYSESGKYFSEGLWTISLDGEKWGAVDYNGKAVIPFEYEFMSSFSNGFASVRKDGKWYFIDKSNNAYEIPSYDGGEAKIAAVSLVGDNGIAAVCDLLSDTTYLVKLPDGDSKDIRVIKDSNILEASIFFSEFDEEKQIYIRISDVDEYQIVEENGKYGFVQFIISEAEDEVIEGTEEEPTAPNPFTDIKESDYFYDAVLWAKETGVTTGATATTFAPDATCTRGQVVTFLWRALGCPEPTTTENPFTDVKETDYFYKAVLWAKETGVTTGTSATAFSPNATCTSGQVITFLWRSNGKPAAEHTGTEYYAEAAAWADANGLLAGTAVEFAPANLSPRADIVTYLYRNAMNQAE